MDPISLAVAGAVAAKGAEMAVKQAPDAWRRLTALVRGRLSREERAAKMLTAAEADQRPELVEGLAEEITRIRHDDPDFDHDLRRAWSAITIAPVQSSSKQATNMLTGSVGGHVVQATEISGGVTFGPVDRPAETPRDGSAP